MKHSKFHVAMLLAVALFVTGATIQTVITKLRQMQDVRLATSPTDGHVLTYNSSLGKWTNAAAAGAGSYVALNNGVVTNLYAYGIGTNKAMKLIDATASRAVILDADKFLTNSTVTSTELGYVSGVTSGIQSQFNLLSLATNSIQNLNGAGTNTTLTNATIITSARVALNPVNQATNFLVDCSTNQSYKILATNNIFISFTNCPSTNSEVVINIQIMQNSTGGHSVTFGSATNCLWSGGTQPGITTNANRISSYTFISSGWTNGQMLGSSILNFQ